VLFAGPYRVVPVFVFAFFCGWGFSPPAQPSFLSGRDFLAPVQAQTCDTAAPSPDSAGSPRPEYENRLETAHFILKWTNKSPHAADNLSDPLVAGDTAGYLEAAWDKLTGFFGKEPYLPPGKSKIEVVFKDLECYAYADPPEGPIQLNASVWMKTPSIRQTTCAHELFHKIQYAYGYKTRWAPSPPVEWFSEGTAAWAEVFVWGRVTRSCKMEDMFKDVDLDLYNAEDMALPFWIYFVSGNRNVTRDRLMVKLFERYEKTGDVKAALFDVIRSDYGPVDKFFSRFARERRKGFWRAPAAVESCPYARILGPDGKDLVAEIREYQSGGKGS
jgi:hypothetical protein